MPHVLSCSFDKHSVDKMTCHEQTEHQTHVLPLQIRVLPHRERYNGKKLPNSRMNLLGDLDVFHIPCTNSTLLTRTCIRLRDRQIREHVFDGEDTLAAVWVCLSN